MTVTSHLIERTSPKGENFIGTCALCGKTDLTIKDANETCSGGKTPEEAILLAIKGPPYGRNLSQQL